MKVVINDCFGGFGLSPLAIKRLAELNGKECYFFHNIPSGSWQPLTLEEAQKHGLFFTAFSVENPSDHLPEEKAGNYGHYNKAYEKITLTNYNYNREDPLLIQVIEELGDKANGVYAALKVVEIPDGTDYEIDEYDGNEHIAEVHQTWS